MMKKELTPAEWANHADYCSDCHKFGRREPSWIDGSLGPIRHGWYERLFTDGLHRHWWSGTQWHAQRDSKPHWRQVGDYPCWRGIETPNVRVQRAAKAVRWNGELGVGMGFYEENPLFELILPYHAYRIWADGRLEGFPKEGFIINRMYPLLSYANGLTKKAVEHGLITAET